MGVQLSGLSEQGSFLSLSKTKHRHLRFAQRLACCHEWFHAWFPSEATGSFNLSCCHSPSPIPEKCRPTGAWGLDSDVRRRSGRQILASGSKEMENRSALQDRGTYRVPARLRELIRTPGWPLALPDVVKCRQGKDAGVTAAETALCSMIDTSRPCAHCEYPETHAFAGSVPNTPWEWVPDLIAPICEWCKRLIMARSGLLRQQDDVPEI